MATVSLADRWWAKVNQDGPIPEHRPELGPCWPWTGARDKRKGKEYGRIRLNGRTGYAHRVAYEEQVGPIPAGHDVLHHCDNPPCQRGTHFFTGTPADNTADMMAKGRGMKGRRARKDGPRHRY